MSKKMTRALPANTTPIRLNETPLLGGGGLGGANGGGRNALAHIKTPGAGVMLEGHDSVEKTAPAAGDAGWYPVLTTTAASANQQEIELPRWIRRGPAGGVDPIVLEGVQ